MIFFIYIASLCRSKVLLNAPREHMMMILQYFLSTFIKLPFVVKTFVLSIFERQFDSHEIPK